MKCLGRYAIKNLLSRRLPSIRFAGTLTSPKLNETLHSRIMALGREQKKVTPPLDEWLKRGKDLNPAVLRGLINSLCESQRFNHALQVSEWITKRGIFDLSTEDFASRLCLVEISTGLKEAEKFFKSIPENMRDDSVHTTLLSLYTISKKTRHEAEATYQTMRVQNMLLKPYPYYSMIYLYALLGEKNMIDEILRQMKENGVEHDKNLTANNVLKAYASLPDVEAMEMFLMGLEVEEPRFSLATELVVDTKSKDSANKVLMMMYWDAGAKQDASRLSRLIYPKSKKGKRMKAYDEKIESYGGDSSDPIIFIDNRRDCGSVGDGDVDVDVDVDVDDGFSGSSDGGASCGGGGCGGGGCGGGD
ncbi:unnamed protein product [Arabidopsis thaliana]|uniref:Uncharacterized protein n=1 Tax=Arabidopsis thaliana TaxID=3702 RepID=A0A654EDJ3_ARATH|nr:unnamed protein product [Arabidopsis thaliana]